VSPVARPLGGTDPAGAGDTGDGESVVDVLLVDDDPDILVMLGFVFDDGRFAVREAVDGRAGLVAIADRAPDVIVTDLMMPNLDGFGMVAEMRRLGLAPDARVLVLSARNDPADIERGRELAVDEHTSKPFDPDALAELVFALGARGGPG
jgi:DNA-binding response OmpR family regulator